jgi:nucleotide-binding universal stress UspA family protein
MQPFAESRFEKGILAAPDRILVATDLTDGDYLIPHVVAQARAGSAHVTLVHGILPSNMLPMDTGALTFAEQAHIDDNLRSIMFGMAAQIQTHGISCDVVAEHGFAADVIRAQIERTKAQRLIMGTHGRHKLAQMALGSVANEVLGSVTIPVLAIGPHARGGSSHRVPRKILHPVSLLGDYKRTAEFAMDLAQASRADLTLLHVLDPDAGDGPYKGSALTRAADALAALAPNGADLVPPVFARVASGNRIEEILHTASQTEADWIVMGVEAPVSFWPFRDSTAYKVLSAATCPVLVFHHEKVAVERERDHVHVLSFIHA